MFVLIINTFFLAFFLQFCEAADASSKEEQRDLSYNSFMGYEPESDVIDKSRIDLDLKEMNSELAKETDIGFHNALKTYTDGTYSKLYVELQLAEAVTVAFKKGAEVYGASVIGKPQGGKLYEDVPLGASTIKVEYHSSRVCNIGVVSPVFLGCFAKSGNISIGYPVVTIVAYSYNIRVDHKNGRTVRQFSTEVQSDIISCDACRYEDYNKFYDYYRQFDYADQLIISAFEGDKTDFIRGNANFKDISKSSRSDFIQIAASSMTIWMYIVLQMEMAIDECTSFCARDGCKSGYATGWDVAAAYYTGSQEDGKLGYMPYYNANMLCENFGTCDNSVVNNEGQAEVNDKIMIELYRGQQKLFQGRCENVRKSKERIVQLMTVPLIQGTLRYTHLASDEDNSRNQPRAEAAAYAASVLPMVYACNKNDATTIYRNLKISKRNEVNFEEVKIAFESNYKCLGIACEDVGGLIALFGDSKYVDGAQPCNYEVPKDKNQEAQKSVKVDINDKQLWLIVGPILTVLVFFCILILRSRRGRFYATTKNADATLDDGSNAHSIDYSNS